MPEGAPPAGSPHIFALHKPRNVVVSRIRDRGARTVFELLPEGQRDWYAVGRLDKDSEGLLLLCDDPRLAQLLMDPGRVATSYLVTVRGSLRAKDLGKIRRGWMASVPRATSPVEVTRLGNAPRAGTQLQVVLHEGRNREIHRLLSAAGLEVRRVIRVGVGPVELADLPESEGRELAPDEVAALRTLVSY